MAKDISCPNCGTKINIDNILAADIEQKYQQEYQKKLSESLQNIEKEKKKIQEKETEFEEKKKKQNEIFAEKLQQEKIKIQASIQEELQKKISLDFETKLQHLERNNIANEEKLKIAREKEIEFLQKEQILKNKEVELEITLQRKLQAERSTITEQIRLQELEKNTLKENEHLQKLRQLEKQLDDQKKLAEEMKRKAEQGSMQLQGETQELLLEEMLHEYFPFDIIEEVGKGVKGADCIQTIRNNRGEACGKIIYESKRTKEWQNVWIDKLKEDMRNQSADVAILVTQTLPKDMQNFGEKEGIWVCSFSQIKSVSFLLRSGIIKVNEANKSQENKGEKMQMLYNYLTGIEFKGQIEAIAEGFLTMKQSILKERIQMEKTWKEREKQLEKVLLNTSGLFGSVKGIAGSSIGHIPLLDGDIDESKFIEN